MKISSRTSPSVRLLPRSLPGSREKMPELISWGSRKNSPTDSTTAKITARAMITFSKDFPSFSANHFSNLEGSSSMDSPASSAERVRVPMPSLMASTKATTPRTMGSPKKVPFFALLAKGRYSRAMLPSGSRTAMAMPVGDFIITPSMTAWPPTVHFFILVRRSFPARWTCAYQTILYYSIEAPPGVCPEM